MPNANDVKLSGAENAEESIKLQLGLGIVSLALIPGYRPKTCWAAAAISTVLQENPSDTMDRRINCKVNRAIRTVVN